MEYEQQVRITRERIAVLIGKKGETKKELEESTGTKLDIDSDEGDVVIRGEDPIKLYSVKEIIRAVGRGFSPENAMCLIKQDYAMEIIIIPDFAKTKAALERLKGRVIGKEGKSRRTIEELTDTNISVYGKTVAVIGRIDGVADAKRAIENLLLGSQHSNVFKWLEKRRRERKTGDVAEIKWD